MNMKNNEIKNKSAKHTETIDCVPTNDTLQSVRVLRAGEQSDVDLDKQVRRNTVVLVFLPNTNELQRFVVAGAFEEINKEYKLHYVVPGKVAEKMRLVVPDILTPSNTSMLNISSERFEKWKKLFESACYQFASLSPSFAIRHRKSKNVADQSSNIKFLFQSGQSLALRLIKRLMNFRQLPQNIRIKFKRLNTFISTAGSLLFSQKGQFDVLVADTLGSMKPLQEIIDLFNRLNPLFCIIPTSLLDLFCNDVVWACDNKKVTCLILQSGWDNLSSKGILHSRTPFMGCWGPQSFRHAKSIQRISSALVHNLGAPHYEFLKTASQEEIHVLRTDLGVLEGERIILFGGSFRQFDETGTLLRLEKAIAGGLLGSLKIVYRPHPWRAARKYEDDFFKHHWKHVIFDPDMRDRYSREQTERGYIKRNVPMFDMVYLSRLLSSVDAVISPMSTLLMEALILDKPTMAIAFGDGKHSHDPSVTSQMTHFSEMKKSKALIWCVDSDRLVDDCSSLFHMETTEKIAKARQTLIKQVVTREPSTYAVRLADLCLRVVEPAGRKARIKRIVNKRETISHNYGANKIMHDYCGLRQNELVVPGYWMHGWIPAYKNVDPAFIALHKKDGQHKGYDYEGQIHNEKENIPQWVSRQDQATFLISNGYKHVQAIGLPIIYLPKPNVRRVPGSLIVMPPHGHKSHGPGDPLAEQYASVIADLRPRFKHIWVGLSEDDIVKNQWVEPFRRYGINVFITAEQTDHNTLSRLMRVLSSFEYMTTNGFGSHIAIAAYCGARVSVYGPYAEFPLERMRKTHAVKMFPELIDKGCYLCSEKVLKEHYPFLFVEPDMAELLEEWGANELGEHCRVPPEDMARLFEWLPEQNNKNLLKPETLN